MRYEGFKSVGFMVDLRCEGSSSAATTTEMNDGAIEPGSQTEQAPPSTVFLLAPGDMHGFRFLTISVAPSPASTCCFHGSWTILYSKRWGIRVVSSVVASLNLFSEDIILKEDHPLDFNMSFAISLGLFPVKLSLETTGCGIKKSVLPVEEAGDLENGKFLFSISAKGSSFLVAGLCKLHCFPPVALAWDATSGLHIFPNLYSETVMVDSSPALWSSTQGFEKTTVLLLLVGLCAAICYMGELNNQLKQYEAWVIYNFLALCLAWVGGPGAVVLSLSGRVLKPSWYLMTCCFSPIPLDGSSFIRRCKQGCLQFVILKPVLVAVTFILYAKGKYHDGNFSVDQSYLYLTVIYTVSYSVALYSLALFYVACRDLLQPFNPVPKFIIIKSVVFLTYWQTGFCGVLVFLAAKSGFIRDTEEAAEFQNFIICVEMLIAAVGHLYTFPYKEYAGANIGVSRGFTASLAHALKLNDFYHDTVHQ
ncbi:unnamed protein product [Camellia sinensis]